MEEEQLTGTSKPDTFMCAWCKNGGCDPDEYTRPIDEIGGFDKDTGEPICEDCADAAQEELVFNNNI